MRADWLKLVAKVGAVGVVACALGACQSNARIDAGMPVYPSAEAVKPGRVLDVQVVRDDTVISFTNTTAHPLPAGRLWVNQWYSREFEGMAIGESKTIGLGEFKDMYGESFRAGGFFATQRPTLLSLVQLEHDGVMDGFVTAALGE